MKKDNFNLERVYEKPIKIFGKQLKIMRVLLIGLVTMVYTGFVYYEIQTLTPAFFFCLGLFIVANSLYLMNKKILYISDYSIECSSAGDVYLTKLEGICPKCKGKLKIIRNQIRCLENSEHKWNLTEI